MAKKGEVDFVVDLPAVFSVVKPEDLVAVANEFYRRPIILPKPGSIFDVKVGANGKSNKHYYLYKITLTMLDEDERQLRENISEFDTNVDNCGIFSSFYDVMETIDNLTLFSSFDEIDIFLKAYLRLNPEVKTKSAFLCSEHEIQGLQ